MNERNREPLERFMIERDRESLERLMIIYQLNNAKGSNKRFRKSRDIFIEYLKEQERKK